MKLLASTPSNKHRCFRFKAMTSTKSVLFLSTTHLLPHSTVNWLVLVPCVLWRWLPLAPRTPGDERSPTIRAAIMSCLTNNVNRRLQRLLLTMRLFF
jgi:hypothetical protein